MGVLDWLAGDPALGLGVADLADPSKSLPAMVVAEKRLRDEDSVDVRIMEYASIAHYLDALRDATGLPVIGPSQAAVAMALGRVAHGLSHKIEGSDHA